MREQKQTKLFSLSSVSARCQNFINADYDRADIPPTNPMNQQTNNKSRQLQDKFCEKLPRLSPTFKDKSN